MDDRLTRQRQALYQQELLRRYAEFTRKNLGPRSDAGDAASYGMILSRRDDEIDELERMWRRS